MNYHIYDIKNDGVEAGGDVEMARVKCYVRDTFCSLTEGAHKRHLFYVFYTSADDTRSIHDVVDSYSFVYEASVLESFGLL